MSPLLTTISIQRVVSTNTELMIKYFITKRPERRISSMLHPLIPLPKSRILNSKRSLELPPQSTSFPLTMTRRIMPNALKQSRIT